MFKIIKPFISLLSLAGIIFIGCPDTIIHSPCIDGESDTGLCGRNNRGTHLLECRNGFWVIVSECDDPDVCRDDEIQTESCGGLNGRAVRILNCIEGQWDIGPCNDPDVCVDHETRTLSCGIAGEGTETETCINGQWQGSGYCYMPENPDDPNLPDDPDDPDDPVDPDDPDDPVIPDNYTLRYRADPSGYITGESLQHVEPGGSGSPVFAEAHTGYLFSGWSDQTDDNPRTDHNITEDIDVTAHFNARTYTVSASAGPDGSIEPSGNITVNHGDSLSFNIIPDHDYVIADVVVNNVSIGAVQSHHIDNITENKSIEAFFRFRPFSFCVLTDTHYADIPDNPDRPRYFRASAGNTVETVTTCNQEGASFIVHLGDIIQEAGNKSGSIARLQVIDNALQNFNGPVHYAIGNHDLGDLTKAEVIASTSGAVNSAYYSFEMGEYVFLIVDPNYTANGTSYSEGNFSWTDSNIPSAQRTWISNTLQNAAARNKKAILFMHQVIDDREGNTQVGNAAQVRSILENAGNVAVVFQGHRHNGGYRYINGIHYVNILAVVNATSNAFGLVTIDGDGIYMEGHGRQSSRTLDP